MKKFLKTLLIIILVCASVGITAYLFYKNLNPEIDYFNELSTYSSCKPSTTLSSNIDDIVKQTSDNGDGRFEIIAKTNANLNNCLDNLSKYFVVANQHKFNKKKIKNGLSSVESARSAVLVDANEYLTKTTAQGDPSVGANPTFESVANYFVEYAKFINTVNNSLSSFGVDRAADIDLAVIEIYCNVCINTFSSLTHERLVNISDSTNLNLITTHIVFTNSKLNLNSFSHLNNLFIKYYNLSDKQDFANKLTIFLNNGSQNSSDSKLIAGYYLNLIFGD